MCRGLTKYDIMMKKANVSVTYEGGAMLEPVNKATQNELNVLLAELEEIFNSDFLNIKGPIGGGLDTFLLNVVEDLAEDENKKDTLLVMITTNGGDALTVERIVNIFREHYREVNFIVPDFAYSAGTILCMSGDNIYMDYFSALGPIDPQIQNKEGRWVPALGYLDKIQELLEKAERGEISEAEFLILKDFDLAEIRDYEQAKELTIDLLQEWLVKYKFKNWEKHKDGRSVSYEEKVLKAQEIAEELNNYRKWKSHGRPLNIEALTKIGLKIEDFGKNPDIKNAVRRYYEMMSDFTVKNGLDAFLHSRRFL